MSSQNLYQYVHLVPQNDLNDARGLVGLVFSVNLYVGAGFGAMDFV